MTSPSQPYRTIPLTKGQVCIVDASDFDSISQWKWCVRGTNKGRYYAVRSTEIGGVKRNIPMHRQILEVDDALLDVDHINGNGLDNRRENLRVATKSQNRYNVGLTTRNKSGFKGVHWHSRAKKWIAAIRENGRTRYLGSYSSPEEAHASYCEAARNLHGEFFNSGVKVG